MEKRLRDYLRHLDKLDFEVISEEEIWEEKETLELRLTEIHQEMMRLLIPMMAFVICACIFLSAGFVNFFIGNFIAAAVFAIAACYIGIRYKNMGSAVKKMCVYIDKLTTK